MKASLHNLSIFVIMLLGKPLRVKHEKMKPADVIIVLGTKVRPDGSPSEGMVLRVRHAVELFNQGLSFSRRLIVTGHGRGDNKPEAQVMLEIAHALGLSNGSLITETQSSKTIDNALRSKQIMDREGWHSAIIVTSPYHVKRAVNSFRLVGVKARGSEAFSPTVYPLLTHFRVVVHEYGAWLNWWARDLFRIAFRGFTR